VRPWQAAIVAAVAYLGALEAPLYLQVYLVTLLPYALLIFACAQADASGARNLLHRPSMVVLGQWSYAFYLVHYLVLRLAIYLAEDIPSAAGKAGIVVASLAVSVALSGALFQWVERPLERRLRRDGGTATPSEEIASVAVPQHALTT
jgi:peptidoglycan/LPS O-acetylase OafA/YrhL